MFNFYKYWKKRSYGSCRSGYRKQQYFLIGLIGILQQVCFQMMLQSGYKYNWLSQTSIYGMSTTAFNNFVMVKLICHKKLESVHVSVQSVQFIWTSWEKRVICSVKLLLKATLQQFKLRTVFFGFFTDCYPCFILTNKLKARTLLRLKAAF